MNCRHISRLLGVLGVIASTAPGAAQNVDQQDPNDPIAGLTNLDVPFEPAPAPELPVVAGTHLTAWSGVREEQHTHAVAFADGYAHVTIDAVIASRARRSGVATYSVPLPPHAIVRSCAPTACTGEASVQLAVATGAGTDALPARTTIRIEYSVPVSYRGGVARFVIPARGSDNRLARTNFQPAPSTSADLPGRVLVDGTVLSSTEPVSLEAHREVEVQHVLERHRASAPLAWRSSVRVEGRVREHVVLFPQELTAQRLHIILDVSPSARGPVRGVVTRALATLLALAPQGTTTTIHAFASRVHAVVPAPIDLAQVSLTQLFDSLELELGGMTQFARAWGVLAPQVSRGHVVVLVGDGTIGTSTAERSALDAIVRRGARLIAISGDATRRTPDLEDAASKTGGHLIALGLGRDQPATADAWLREELSEVFTPASGVQRADPALRSGAAQVRTLVSAGSSNTMVRSASDPYQFTWTTPGAQTVAARAHPASWQAFAIERRVPSIPSSSPTLEEHRRNGLAAETVLYQLRTQLVPLARACFRADRAGRAQYSSRAVFSVSIERGEIARAEVDARPNPLLRCMRGALEDLRLPYSTAVINVRYPLVTRPEQPEEPVELTDETRHSVARALE